jgi:hypothetical protein
MEHEDPPDTDSPAWKIRYDALTRARVFVPHVPDIGSVDFSLNPNDPQPFRMDVPLACRYVPEPISGTTPKFECQLTSGEIVKVKYGRTPEVPAEVAATRLLAALGFGADHVSLVNAVDCLGCPASPYRRRQIAAMFMVERWMDRDLDYGKAHRFERVAVERKLEGRSIETPKVEGWKWGELEHVAAGKGGASRAELDALRLIAIVLGHWDNKSSNQRLLCLDPDDDDENEGARCETPLLMLQDLGATFGPTKVNYEKWSATPVWSSVEECTVSMERMPYDGATFTPARITEAGRRLLAGKLTQLTEQQLFDLFRGADFPAATDRASNDDVTAWVRALQSKIRQIADRAPCPR